MSPLDNFQKLVDMMVMCTSVPASTRAAVLEMVAERVRALPWKGEGRTEALCFAAGVDVLVASLGGATVTGRLTAQKLFRRKL